MNENPVFTIGHSTHSIETFVAMLRQQAISVVADVRSAPYSRFAPQFSRQPFSMHLRSIGVKYVFLGRELGARSEDPSCYEHGRVQYGRLAQTPLFRSGIERVVRGVGQFRLALMCAEREPLACHRTLLVARVLRERGLVVRHILAEGRVESHEATMERLLRLVRLPDEDLFKPREALVAEAIARQEERIAFTDEKMAPGPESESI